MTVVHSHSSRLRRWLAVSVVLLGALGTVYWCRGTLLAGAGGWLNVGTHLDGMVDDVMVLGGDPGTRPFVAAAMVRRGLARNVLVPQTVDSTDATDGIIPPHHKIVREALLRLGVDDEAVIPISGSVASTEDEARCLARFFESHQGHRVAVVTSDYHTRRARLLFSRVCPRDAGRIQFIAAPTDGFSSSNWWRSEVGVSLYVNEYLKLIKALIWR